MKIRPYRKSDFEEVIQLWWDSWHSSSGYRHHRPISGWKQRWHNLEITHTIVVIAHQETAHQETIVAFAALNTSNCILSQIFVSSAWKRKGLGKQLMHWVSVQCPNGFSLKAAADNSEARAFYKGLGLVETGHSINDFNGRKEIEYSSQK